MVTAILREKNIFVIESYIFWQRIHIGFINYIHYDLVHFHKHTTSQHSFPLNKLFSSSSVKYYDWQRKQVIFLNAVSLWCCVFVTVTEVLINMLDKTSLYSSLHRCASLVIVWGVLDRQGEPWKLERVCMPCTAPSALYTRPTKRLSRPPPIHKLDAENHMLQLNI